MSTTEEKIKSYIGKAKYDEAGQIIMCVDKNGGDAALVDLRGWGRLQNMFPTEQEAVNFQDEVGKFITDAINEKLNKI